MSISSNSQRCCYFPAATNRLLANNFSSNHRVHRNPSLAEQSRNASRNQYFSLINLASLLKKTTPTFSQKTFLPCKGSRYQVTRKTGWKSPNGLKHTECKKWTLSLHLFCGGHRRREEVLMCKIKEKNKDELILQFKPWADVLFETHERAFEALQIMRVWMLNGKRST